MADRFRALIDEYLQRVSKSVELGALLVELHDLRREQVPHPRAAVRAAAGGNVIAHAFYGSRCKRSTMTLPILPVDRDERALRRPLASFSSRSELLVGANYS